MQTLRIGQRAVGPGQPVYFIAEAGSNHNRDLAQALRLVEVAAEAGADAVKFQTFRADHLYPRSAGMTDYLAIPRSIYDIIRDLEMPLDWIPVLAERCRALGIDFLSTPFDEASADALAPHVPAFKIASYEMTHHGLVQHCARKGKPLIVSTGTADLEEVRELVAAVAAVGHEGLALLQCTAKYPAPLDTLGVRAMATMAREFGVPVGLSDHSREPLPGPLAAVALGASILEKHFTLSNRLPGPDHPYALEPGELAELIRQVRAVERALGDGVKRPHAAEEELRVFARRSVFTTRPVVREERLVRSGLEVLRCGKLAAGLHPREYLRTLGRRVRRDLPSDTAVRTEDLEPFVLGTPELQLRPLAAEDAERVVAWRQRPDVHGQFFAARPPTLAEHRAWFERLLRRSDRVEFVIVADEVPVGTIGLSAIDLGAGSAEYGVLIGEPQHRGRGLGRRASELLLDYAFTVLELGWVRLELFADNAAARGLYGRLGFEVEEPPSPAREKDGQLRPVLGMRLGRVRWGTRKVGV